MPRAPRVFVEGGIYHPYNRVASGEPVVADPEVALEYIELRAWHLRLIRSVSVPFHDRGTKNTKYLLCFRDSVPFRLRFCLHFPDLISDHATNH
jgi:hypothetical protein